MIIYAWWHRRSHNQKRGMIALALFWLSLQTLYFYQQVQAQKVENTLTALQPYAQHLARLQAALPTPTSAAIPLKTLLEKSTQRHGVTLLTLQPQDGDIDVVLAPIAFNQFISWLAELQREHGIQVRTLKITVLPSSGQINVETLRLQRSLTY